MIEMSFQEFKTLQRKELFIFFFTMPDFCGLCTQQENEYKKYNIPNLVKVKADNEDQLMEMGIKALPYTCMFSSDGKNRIEHYGVLYEPQIRKLLGEYDKKA